MVYGKDAVEAAFQLTLPVWGATRAFPAMFDTHEISTHAPRVGSDDQLRGQDHRTPISTHAPRVGSDADLITGAAGVLDFNSRSPCGERPKFCASETVLGTFQLTLPVWGAT